MEKISWKMVVEPGLQRTLTVSISMVAWKIIRENSNYSYYPFGADPAEKQSENDE